MTAQPGSSLVIRRLYITATAAMRVRLEILADGFNAVVDQTAQPPATWDAADPTSLLADLTRSQAYLGQIRTLLTSSACLTPSWRLQSKQRRRSCST